MVTERDKARAGVAVTPAVLGVGGGGGGVKTATRGDKKTYGGGPRRPPYGDLREALFQEEERLPGPHKDTMSV